MRGGANGHVGCVGVRLASIDAAAPVTFPSAVVNGGDTRAHPDPGGELRLRRSLRAVQDHDGRCGPGGGGVPGEPLPTLPPGGGPELIREVIAWETSRFFLRLGEAVVDAEAVVMANAMSQGGLNALRAIVERAVDRRQVLRGH